LRLSFAKAGGIPATLSRLVEAETDCCGFVEWKLLESVDEFSIEITGHADGLAAMEASFGIARS
jgi:hypothetical protein